MDNNNVYQLIKVADRSVLWTGDDAESFQAAVDAQLASGVTWEQLKVQVVKPVAAPVEVAPAVETPAAPVAKFGWTGDGNTVSEVAAARAVQDAATLAADLGIQSAPPVYAPGSRLVGMGRENLVRSHSEWAAMPLVIDAVTDLQQRVEAEQRIDYRSVDLGSAQMLPTGQLAVNGGVGFEGNAFEKAAAAAGFPSGSAALLRAMKPAHRALVWNEYSGVVQPAATRTLRTRIKSDGSRNAFALVGDGYAACDADKLAATIAEALRNVPGGDTARGEVVYWPDGSHVAIDGQWHANDVQDFGAGDYFKLGFRITSADNGGGAIRIAPVAVRNLCLNLIIIDEAEGEAVRIIHRGDAASMTLRVTDAITRITRAYQPFLHRWGHATQTDVAAALPGAADTDTFIEGWARTVAGIPVATETPDLADQLRDGWKLPEPPAWGVSRDVLADAVRRQTMVERGRSIATLVNGVTALHREPLPIRTVHLAETYAGQLLTALTPR